MPTRIHADQEVTLFKKGRKKSEERWFVQMTCNLLEPRVYGPFPTEEDAKLFQQGAEFELRKLLDFDLRIRSGGYGLGLSSRGKTG